MMAASGVEQETGAVGWAEARSPFQEEVTAPSSVDSDCGAWQAADTVAGFDSGLFPK